MNNTAKIALRSFYLPDARGWQGINVNKLHYIKGKGSYTTICTNTEEVIISKTLSFFEPIIERYPQLLRVHKSYIVNIDNILRIDKGTIWSLVLPDDIKIPVSTPYKAAIIDALYLKVHLD